MTSPVFNPYISPDVAASPRATSPAAEPPAIGSAATPSHTPGSWRTGYPSWRCLNPVHTQAGRHPGPPECVYEFAEWLTGENWDRCVSDVESAKIVVGYDESGPILNERQAALIAAAPELLEELVAMRRLYLDLVALLNSSGQSAPGGLVYEKAGHAIAKAVRS